MGGVTGWRDMLATGVPQILLYPWTGGRELRCSDGRAWTIPGQLPPEHGWFIFELCGRVALLLGPRPEFGGPLAPTRWMLSGYVAGDRLLPDGARPAAPTALLRQAERIHLLPPEAERFARVRAGRTWEGGPLIFFGLEMPLGPEPAVTSAFLDREPSLRAIPGVTPALEAAFSLECWRREEADRRRAELERQRQEEQLRLERQAFAKEAARRLGDGAGRRALALSDFDGAARAALAVGGAELLDVRRGVSLNEMVVRFRLDGRRFECVCDRTLGIIDSGICLHAEHDHDGFEAGTRGDRWFTLESLPSVIREAERQGRLVVFRHV